MKRGAAVLTMLVMVALLPFQVRCGSSSSNAEQQVATQAEEPGLVQISHNVPAELTLLDVPYIAEFILEMPGTVGDIAYYVVQSSAPDITYLPNGITYKELLEELDLTKYGSPTILVAAANNDGAITRQQVEINLTMDCVGCDLSCKEQNHSGNYDCATFFNMDFSGADLSWANLRGQHLAEGNFTGATLIGTDFSTDLDAEHKVITKLHRAKFIGANLTDANFENGLVYSVEWDDATCPDGSFAADHGQTCIGYGVEEPPP